MVPYEGQRSHEPMYSFCFLCKERLDTVHNESDEGWYFVNTKQVRYRRNGQSKVVNVHSSCLKEIEQTFKDDKKSMGSSVIAQSKAALNTAALNTAAQSTATSNAMGKVAAGTIK